MACKYFLPYVCDLFALLSYRSFLVNVVPLVYFRFCCHDFCVKSKQSLPRPMSRRFLPMFSLRKLTVFPASFVEETIPSALCPYTFVEDQLTVFSWAYFWYLCFIPLVYVSVFMPVLYCFNYCSFVVYFGIGKYDATNSSFSRSLWLFGAFYDPCEICFLFL